MNRSRGKAWRRLPGLAACAGLLAAVCSCEDPKIRTASPPKPGAVKKTFDYQHRLKQVERARRPVVALMRAGDTIEMADVLPFGRGVTIVRTDPEGRKRQVTRRTGEEDAPILMPVSIRQFLLRELAQHPEIVVVQRERILEIIRELKFTETRFVDAQASPRVGHLIGVHYFLEPGFFPAGCLAAEEAFRAEVQKRATGSRRKLDPAQQAVVYLNTYEVETGLVKMVGFGADVNPAVAVRKAVEDLADQFAEVGLPIKVVKVEKDTAILDIGSEAGIKIGDRFRIADPTVEDSSDEAEADKSSDAAVRVTSVRPVYCWVKFTGGNKKALREGYEARLIEPKPKKK